MKSWTIVRGRGKLRKILGETVRKGFMWNFWRFGSSYEYIDVVWSGSRIPLSGKCLFSSLEGFQAHFLILPLSASKESWTKLFVVGPYNCSIVCPVTVGNKNCIFFSEEDSELGWLDLSIQRVERIDVQGESFCTHVVIYKENLPFPRNE
jgi:hypothetical protein